MPIHVKSAEVAAVVQKVVAKWHAELAECEVRFVCCLVFAEIDNLTGEYVGSGLTDESGYRLEARATPVSSKYRAECFAQVSVEFDGGAWSEMSKADRECAIDNALCSIRVQRDKDGEPRLDSSGLVKVSSVRPDAKIAFFQQALARHGSASYLARRIKDHGEMLTKATA